MRNNIKRFSVAVLAACGLAVSAALAAPSYQAKLTVQGYAEDKEPLENFPVLVRLSPQTVDGFYYGTCKAVGSDVVFVDANGEPLPYQLDTWNPSGESLFWVKLPQPSPGGVWFPSADKSAQSRALGGLVLKGSGKIDDLCVVEEDPFLGIGERALILLR